MKPKVLVVGLGLIGGSLALNIVRQNDYHVIGYDVNKKTLLYAEENGIIDERCDNFKEVLPTVDICILSTPVSKTVELIESFNEIEFTQPLIVTDVSSVKGNVMKAAEKIESPHVSFIGGHPMAGSHKKGVEAAKAHLFENAIYILSPCVGVPEETVNQLKNALQPTDCQFLELNPDEHDEMTSVISHFPHLIASSLVHQAKNWQEKHDYIQNLAAGGFRDITRIASSNPAMWQDIFFQNKHILSNLLTDWIKEMKDLRKLLESDDKTTMYHYLEQAREYRDGLDHKKRGAIPAFYDLFVDIFDQPGALLKVVSYLAEEQISIKNIEILEIREGITGVLRLSFVSKEDQIASQRLLVQKGYETMIED
ncbi:prephenate dehydrogenase [Pelagirhabdus alkalitolerans]|uniref:Prephenate dehydrogenase n=1 Tax=Pelagirhabdus alkalitolerans TaxID=1612202 RepID=A0A1G6HCU4_9BACI|nr:prephenate dehydrogenase [Pelagirhabdus alkalitolerans]SDB91256.1 prephenate dehydrogenase [Pelagirhabdus alkalitolerans]